MRWLASGVCVIVVVAAQLGWCGPVAREDSEVQRSLSEQDALEALPLDQSGDQDAPRNRRNLGLIRQYFPGLARIIDSKIQMITRWLFRVVGRLVLRGGILGGGGGGGGGAGGGSGDGGSRRVSIVLPTFPPAADDEEEDQDAQSTDAVPTTSTDANPAENQLGAESRVYESRVAPPRGFFDLEPAASSDDAEVAASNDDAVAEASEDGDEARNKRLIGLGGDSSGGSGAGSGNFIFDIIRLVTGSSNTEATDDGAQVSAGVSVGAEATAERDDGYQAGIPGPITRLFIIANRGIANLVQDLILRLAQTSERIVNFKARLITSII